MAWHIPIWYWLAHSALGGLLLLAGGCAVARLCQQPVRRLRVLELTLLGCLLVPWLHLVPGLPQWSLGWLTPAPTANLSTPPVEEAVVRSGRQEQIQPSPVEARSREEGDPTRSVTGMHPQLSAETGRAGAPQAASLLAWLSLPRALVFSYLTMAVAVQVWWLMGLVRLVQLYRSTYPAPCRTSKLFQEIAGRASERVALLASDHLELPLTFTWRRPMIVLPGKLCRGSDETALRYCLAHEWSHVVRHDIWIWQVVALAQVFCFYQPFFWWLRRQLRLCQDYLADARAAAQARSAEDYAEYLVHLARRGLANPLPVALGIGDRWSNLHWRVIMLIHRRQTLDQRCRGLWTCACALGMVGLLAGVSAIRLDAAPGVDTRKEPGGKDASQAAGKGESFSYTGKVFDKDTGKGIAGATVTVRRTTYGDPKGEKVLEETKHTTDAEGKYRCVIPPEQAAEHFLYIELDVEAPGYAPRSHFGYSFAMIRKNEKMGGRPFFENVDLRPAKEITGLVETPEGKPATGIKVLAYSNTSKSGDTFEYGSFANAKTDDQGRFRLWLITPGPAVFWLLPQKYAPSTHVLKDPAKRGDMGRFILSPGVVLNGKAVDTDGKPLPGIYIHARKQGGIEDFNLPVADQISRTAVTNDQGEFVFAPLPPARYEVFPEEHGYDASTDERRPPKRPLPNLVFVRQHVTLKDGSSPESIEVRAAPHVVIEAQYRDSKGKPTHGHEGHIFGRFNKNDSWFGQGKVDENGRMTILAPHGLNNTRLSLMTNEHGALRHRLTKDGPLSNSREIDLGTLNDDVKGIEIIRYVAPVLVVDAVDATGSRIKNFQAKVEYAPGKSPRDRRGSFINGVKGDVFFEKQEDGRWRSSQLFPNEDITVTVSADGFQPYQEKMKLAEGTTNELTAKLDKQLTATLAP
jgi:beta-lactamase regulating signal transducer with metallopeptidase domain/protocatechuate 3,4-dioxygenase beta subunit